MRFEVKARLGQKTYTVYKDNSLLNCECFAESFHRNNTYETTYVTRRGEVSPFQGSDGKLTVWGKPL